MAQRAPFSRPPVVLLASPPGTWLSQALASLLEPRGYHVLSVSSGRELLDHAPEVQPDAIVLDADLSDRDSVGVCRTLRANRAAWNVPIIMITSTPATKQQRIAALEGGAWDYLSVLLNPEELTLKLEAMVRLKLETDRVLGESAVDPTSGLYTMRGLERRARELTSDAFRRHAPLACLALGIELDPKGAPAGAHAAALPAAIDFAAQALQAGGRTSDAIGRAGRGEFTVLAPATAPEGAVKMAQRLSRVIETAGPRPTGVPPLRVRAGYEAVADLHATPIEPVSLLEHASTALHRMGATGAGERIRAYQS
ncbi:MAG TPA: response regulator [Gemmatimonadales bacterium]|nr:response regulator [Gemmatimonadales bacterium]